MLQGDAFFVTRRNSTLFIGETWQPLTPAAKSLTPVDTDFPTSLLKQNSEPSEIGTPTPCGGAKNQFFF